MLKLSANARTKSDSLLFVVISLVLIPTVPFPLTYTLALSRAVFAGPLNSIRDFPAPMLPINKSLPDVITNASNGPSAMPPPV
jgi:hypothetical protein